MSSRHLSVHILKFEFSSSFLLILFFARNLKKALNRYSFIKWLIFQAFIIELSLRNVLHLFLKIKSRVIKNTFSTWRKITNTLQVMGISWSDYKILMDWVVPLTLVSSAPIISFSRKDNSKKNRYVILPKPCTFSNGSWQFFFANTLKTYRFWGWHWNECIRYILVQSKNS